MINNGITLKFSMIMKGGYCMINSISSVGVQNMASIKQNIQPSSKANEEATESASEKAREAGSKNPSAETLIDVRA